MENFKDITEHQLEVGEVGVYRGLTYIALENPSLVDVKCDECDICNICCPDVMCEFDIYLKRHIVTKKEDIDPILESIDDTSNDGSDPIETITITKSEYKDLLYHSLHYCEELSEIDRHNKELKVKIDKLHSKIKDLLNGRDNNSRN